MNHNGILCIGGFKKTTQSSKHTRFKPLHGFTLIELLVVIAIIALLVSILLPSLNRAKELARDVLCSTTVRNLGTSLGMYVNDNDGVLIPAAVVGGDWNPPVWRPWFFVLMPYMGTLEESEIDAAITAWKQPGMEWRMCPSSEIGAGEIENYDTVSYGWNHANFGISTSYTDPDYGYATQLEDVPRPSEIVLLGDSQDSTAAPGYTQAYRYRYLYYTSPNLLPGRHNDGGYFLHLDWSVVHHEASWIMDHREAFEFEH